MAEEYDLWAVRYDVASEVSCDTFNNGILYVVARNKYEALGKALTVPGMEDTLPDPASFEIKRVELLHPEDSNFKIELSDLVDW
ncbi:hypothetical protein GOV03_02235 [Candidatus Woesearchaeota archaeon]|nr:hypothetical protein [Candidatus Woesearchaeota archaeon]